MNLKSALENCLRASPSVLGIYILDKDGLVVERVEAPGASGLEDSFVEFLQGFKNLEGSARELSLGPAREMSLLTDGYRYIFRLLEGGYCLALAQRADGYFGEGSWRLRTLSADVAADFAQ